MQKQQSSSKSISDTAPVFAPRLLIETEPGHRVFLRNLGDLFFPRLGQRHAPVTDYPAFWPDVFVPSGLPWWRFVESFAIHALLIAGVWGASRAWLLRPQLVPPPVFSQGDVIYFPASEYLPPLDTGTRTAPKAQKGDPEFSKQAILSVPPEADNRTQTVVTPPDIQLKNDVALPNIVEWNSVTPAVPMGGLPRIQVPTEQSSAIIAPPPTIEQAGYRRRLDTPANSVIAPPPDVAVAASLRLVVTPESAVIEPPPAVQMRLRHVGDINIGHSDVVPPAPQLPMHEQRASGVVTAGGSISQTIVPPPPSVNGAALSETRSTAAAGRAIDVVPPPALANTQSSQNRIVAFGLHPVAGAPPVASGNRRGTFALSPKGRIGASGTPDIAAAAGRARGGNGSAASAHDLPPGLLVQPAAESAASPGSAEKNSADASTLMAEAKPPLRVAPGQHQAIASVSAPTAEEREVFGGRKFYSMTLNMPNLNSAGGSWVIRFAELRGADAGELTTPEPIRKVDPAYPLELMKTLIEGKVTLYAVIRSDGTVADVRVLSSVDERLDQYACSALSHWRFRPATKAGSAVDLQAVVTIPFRARPVF